MTRLDVYKRQVELMVEQAVTDIQKELFESSHRNEYVLERMKRISKRAVWAMEDVYKRQHQFLYTI